MIKVRILTGMTAASAAALAIPSMTGCTADAQDNVGLGTEANTESVAGSGSITLHSYQLGYTSTSGGDEFIRVGEKMKMSLSLDDLLQPYGVLFLGGASDAQAIADLKKDPSKLTVEVVVSYTKFDDSTSSPPAVPMTFAPGPGGVTSGTSQEFVIPAGVKSLKIELAAHYPVAGKPTTRQILASHGITNEFVVFGAFLPNKLALFDTNGASKRTRIVEGGSIVRGSHVELSYTDYRLDTICDKNSFDLRIGRRQSYNRFGPSIVDALGQLEYVVGAVVSTDGGATFTPTGLTKAMRPDVFARNEAYRFAMQGDVPIPAGASGPSVQVAFHIQAYLVVPTDTSGLSDARYSPGQRVLLKDVWDNNDGANYALPLGNN